MVLPHFPETLHISEQGGYTQTEPTSLSEMRSSSSWFRIYDSPREGKSSKRKRSGDLQSISFDSLPKYSPAPVLGKRACRRKKA